MEKTDKNVAEDLVLFERKKLEMHGIVEVLSCTEKEAHIKLEKDFVCVLGQGLKIVKLLPESKFLSLSGVEIKAISYSSTRSKKSLFAKVFK